LVDIILGIDWWLNVSLKSENATSLGSQRKDRPWFKSAPISLADDRGSTCSAHRA
jgi:hypothetical protein